MITGIDHVQISVSPGEVEQARTFYCGLLGLLEVEKPESLKSRGGFWLRAGDRQVHVGIEEGVDRALTKAHIAYRVVGIASWRRRLAEAGIEVLDGIPIPGHVRFEFRDPFGNRVELIEELATHAGSTGSISYGSEPQPRNDVPRPGRDAEPLPVASGLSSEERARLVDKARRLYHKSCGNHGGVSCLESFAAHQLRLGRVEVVDDVLRFLDGQMTSLLIEDPQGLLPATEMLEARIGRYLDESPPEDDPGE